MQSFSSFLRETFTAVYPWHLSRETGDFMRYEFSADGQGVKVDMHVARPDDGIWSQAKNTNPEHEIELSFYVDDELKLTGLGQGVKFKIFGTVLACTRDYITRHRPARIHFTSTKFKDDTSRSSLYVRMIQRFAEADGYKLEKVYTGMVYDKFTLVRKS